MSETQDVAGPTQVAPVSALEPPQYRPLPVEVVRTERLSPNFLRVTFGGSGVDGFGMAGCDQRIKLLFAPDGATRAPLSAGDDWYLRWRELPDDRRPVMRTYTVRAFRPAAGELDVDFVLHGSGTGHSNEAAGPASSWAATARAGDVLDLVGPDRSGRGRLWGVEWSPPSACGAALLAGDETAVPAVSAILESLRPGLAVRVCLEVPTADDVLPLPAAPGADVSWLVRSGVDGEHARGDLLEAAVRDLLPAMLPDAVGTTVPDQGRPFGTAVADDGETDPDALLWDIPEPEAGAGELPYVWLAGEAEVMKRLRRFARQELALPRTAVACMGYWRRGRSES